MTSEVIFELPDEVRVALETLRNENYNAHIVGGAIRDLLLGESPRDWDIATDAKPAVVRKLFGAEENEIKERFGGVLLNKNSVAIEVQTFRLDGDYPDGRNPRKVLFVTKLEWDIPRRDFTINALALDEDDRTIIDYTGGVDDLKHRLIRTIGEPYTRLTEDNTRIARAEELLKRYPFLQLEKNTKLAIDKIRQSCYTVIK
jgi:tRNA nucleotidyltransferase (CCA-adding enzyme)